jgi:hypothetical protein
MTEEKKWLKSDSVELWDPRTGKPFQKVRRRPYPKVETLPGTGRGRRKLKMRVGE